MPPVAFSCPLTVSGFEARADDDADGDLDLPGAELQALVDDGFALVGYADFYQSANILGLSGPQDLGNGKYTINARGALEDGTRFRLLVADSPGETRQVHLTFGK